jgi:hypothetical protein
LFYGLIFEKKQLQKFKKICPKIDRKHQYLPINAEKIKKIESFMKGLTY